MLNRASLRLLGIWPLNDHGEQELFVNVRVVLILILSFSCAIPSIHSLIRIWGNLILMIDNLQYTVPLLITILKTFIIWWRKEELKPLLTMIKTDWLKSKTENERCVMIRRARITRILTICGYIMILLMIFLIIILPTFGITMRYVTNMTDPGKLLPIQSYYIYNVYQSPIYEITFLVQSVGLISVGVLFTSTDSFLGLLILHICGQLENLRARILQLDKSSFDSIMSYNLQDHKRLIRSVKIIDDTFTIMLLALLVYFGIFFALEGFLFVTMISDGSSISPGRIFFFTTVFLSTFTHMLLYCILGEILITQCEGIYDAICEYEWYILKPKKAKNLLLMMIRTNKPLYITAGRLFPMTMSTFCHLLKTSGGYISVLLAHRG